MTPSPGPHLLQSLGDITYRHFHICYQASPAGGPSSILARDWLLKHCWWLGPVSWLASISVFLPKLTKNLGTTGIPLKQQWQNDNTFQYSGQNFMLTSCLSYDFHDMILKFSTTSPWLPCLLQINSIAKSVSSLSTKKCCTTKDTNPEWCRRVY